MPLVVFCGIPSSGKTTRALELKAYLEEKHKSNVIILNEETLNLVKTEAYKDYTAEKMTRAFLKSNVEKNVNKNTVVILDSLNYIKGYRYELFCLARSAQTPHCVVYMDISRETARAYSEKNEGGLVGDLFEDYAGRMEVPNQKNRWDSPLFQVREGEPTPCEEITRVILFEEKTSKDPVSTRLEAKLPTNFAFELEKRVQNIIDAINDKQNSMFTKGMTVQCEGCSKKLVLHQNVSLIELKKFKKEFFNMMKLNPVKDMNEIGDSFITFLEAAFQRL